MRSHSRCKDLISQPCADQGKTAFLLSVQQHVGNRNRELPLTFSLERRDSFFIAVSLSLESGEAVHQQPSHSRSSTRLPGSELPASTATTYICNHTATMDEPEEPSTSEEQPVQRDGNLDVDDVPAHSLPNSHASEPPTVDTSSADRFCSNCAAIDFRAFISAEHAKINLGPPSSWTPEDCDVCDFFSRCRRLWRTISSSPARSWMLRNWSLAAVRHDLGVIRRALPSASIEDGYSYIAVYHDQTWHGMCLLVRRTWSNRMAIRVQRSTGPWSDAGCSTTCVRVPPKQLLAQCVLTQSLRGRVPLIWLSLILPAEGLLFFQRRRHM